MKYSKEQQKVLDVYVALVKKLGRLPGVPDIEKAGVTRHKIRHHFTTVEDMRCAAKDYAPAVFKDVIDADLFTPTRYRELKDEAAKFKRFVVVTAVTGCRVHSGFLSSLRTYCKENQALLLVMNATDPAALASRNFFLDKVLKDDFMVLGSLALNKKIHLNAVKLSAKHIDPVTSMGRVGQRNGSFIYASPKQRLKMTPTSNKKLPHAVMTTGCCTVPDYASGRYMSDRTAFLADHDHVMGGIIVEIRNEKRFHFRQFQADKSGAFADLGIMYSRDDVYRYSPAALDMGDWHSGETDPVAKSCFLTGDDSVWATTEPSILVVHDGFNGLSINHHEIKDPILRARRAAACQLSLEDEVRGYANDLDMMTEKADSVVIADSNHDDFFYRYLTEGMYRLDPHNFKFAIKVLDKVNDGKHAVRAAVELIGLKHPEKIRWLDRDEDYKIAGIELGAHGDKGANGARGSLRAMENAYGNSVSGHSHSPEILRGAWQVGTLSKLKLDYNKGPSSWLHTSCLVYPNGMRQLINAIDGHWRLKDGSIELLDDSEPSPAQPKARKKAS